MPQDSQPKLKYVELLFGIGFGLILGKFLLISDLTIDSNINLVDICSILATLVAAFWVSKVLDKQKQDFRSSKDLFLKRAENIDGIVEDFLKSVSVRSNIQFSDITSNIKKIKTSVSSIDKLLIQNNFTIDKNLKPQILSLLNQINALLTQTPISDPADPNREIQIANGLVTISEPRLNQVEVKFEDLKNLLLQYQLAINNA